MPKISVIVPFYNAESTLKRCIDSILAQDYEDFELLLVDDGSTDRGGQIADIQALNDDRIRVFHKPNGGTSSARNMGIDSASGEWVTFCDADDWVYPCWLKNYVVVIGPDVDLVVQGFEIELERGKDREMRRYGFDYHGDRVSALTEMYEFPMPGSVCFKIFRKGLFEENNLRFDERFNYQEDEEFLLRYATLCGKISCTSIIGYHYHVTSSSTVKYAKVNFPFELSMSIYKAMTEIGVASYDSIFFDRISENLLAALIDSYKEKESSCLSKLRQVRQLMGRRILHTRFFFLSRWVIYLDFTTFISSAVLSLHAKIKCCV